MFCMGAKHVTKIGQWEQKTNWIVLRPALAKEMHFNPQMFQFVLIFCFPDSFEF